MIYTENKSLAADESIITADGKLDAMKTGMILYNSFSNTYLSLGDCVGKAWGEGRKFVSH